MIFRLGRMCASRKQSQAQVDPVKAPTVSLIAVTAMPRILGDPSKLNHFRPTAFDIFMDYAGMLATRPGYLETPNPRDLTGG
jgi:hypothetical protein